MAMPGTYTVGMDMVEDGDVIALTEPVPFKTSLLQHSSLPARDYEALVAFQKEVSELSRVMAGSQRLAQEQMAKLGAIKKALIQTPEAGVQLGSQGNALEAQLRDIQFALNGPQAKASWEELPPMQMPLNRRLSTLTYTHWSSTSELSQTETDQLEILREEFPPVLAQLEQVVDEIRELDRELERLKAPWTPGRVPELD